MGSLTAGKPLLVVALAFVLVATMPMAAAEPSPGPPSPASGVLPPPTAGDAPSGLRGPTDKALANVIVVTTDIAALTEYVSRLTGVPVRTPRPRGFATPLLSLPRGIVEEIRKLPSTVDVFDYTPPVKTSAADPEPLSGSGPAPTNWNATINHKAPAAWARNITGSGVNVAIPDDGVDFGNPDLQGTTARVTDPSSPYYGWPIAFDPYSLSTYLSQNGDPKGTWYADTSSTDPNVTHTLKVDGKNDFWTDGTELVGTDPVGDMSVPDYDLTTLYATQDATTWYFGFSSRANHTTMAFGLYINTTAGGGANIDPLGNYVVPQPGYLPEFAVYMVHNGLQPPGLWDLNDTIPTAAVYKWDGAGSRWLAPRNVTDGDVGGAFGYSGYQFAAGEGFVELGIPKAYLGNPAALSAELFSVGANRSHAQDTAYSDPNVAFPAPDWSTVPTTLSASVAVGRGYWQRTYVRPDDTVAGRPNARMTWPTQYVVTGTSRSGRYQFGYLPDKNYALTRVLVVDEAVAGVYDTVYVDLDHNKDFRNDKPMKRYGKYDAGMNWHPPTWAGAGTLYDETSWMDMFDPAGGVVAVAWSPDGRWLASAGRDHQVVVWDTSTWTPRVSLNGHHGRVTSVAWNPASTRLAAGYDDVGSRTQYAVDVWQTSDWSLFRTYTVHTGAVRDLAFGPTGNQIVTASADGTAKIYDLTLSSVVRTYSEHTGPVTGVAWSSFNILATASAEGRAKLWGPGSSTSIQTCAYGSPLNDVAFSPTGTFIALAAQDGNVVMCDAATGAMQPSGTAAHSGNPVLHVAFNGTAGDLLVSSSDVTSRSDPTLALWSVTAWNNYVLVNQKFGAHTDATKGYAVPAAEFSPSGTRIASGGMDAAVRLWTSPALATVQPLIAHTIGSTDTSRYNAGDGIADVSGGMVYFIAHNGTKIPYSDRFLSRSAVPNLVNIIPANGTLVALMGAYDLASKHGTLMASSIVGRGVTRYYDPTNMRAYSPPQVVGIAPNAKVIAIADAYQTTFFDAWWFAVEGYDGVPGTGDEARIVANGFSFPGTYEDGWDFYSRFADWISTQYSRGKTVFTAGAGDNGNGYGTLTSPAAGPGVVSVGASTDFNYRIFAGLEKGISGSHGDVVPFSSRGPSALGKPGIDLLADGRMSVGSTPLNMVTPTANGAVASELWQGTSLSSPLVAGILALVYEAYRKAHGAYPDAGTAKSIVTGGADDVAYDVFSQGAGFANADRATKIAGGLDGVSVSPPAWTPGTYRGTVYDAFVSLMSAGETRQGTFAVSNANRTAAATWLLSDSVFHRTATVEYDFATPVDAALKPVDNWDAILAASPAANASGGAGVYHVTPTGLTRIKGVDEARWINADLVKITVLTPQRSFDPGLSGTNTYQYMLDAYDWTETDPLTLRPDPATFADLNRMSISHPAANVISATIHNPAIRTHDGLVYGVRVFPTGLGGLPIHVKIEFFEKADWNWLTLPAQVVVPANGSAPFTATMAVPAGTPMGTYPGEITLRGLQTTWDRVTVGASASPWARLSHPDILAPLAVRVNGAPLLPSGYLAYPKAGLIWINRTLAQGDLVEVQYPYYDHVTIPVAVSVGATGPQISFGGFAAGQDELYGNFVGDGFGTGGKAGDSRFFYTDIEDQGLFQAGGGLKFYLDTKWQRNRTDVDVFAFGTGGAAPLDVSGFDPARYGPYLLGKNNGGSTVTSNVFTTTGGPEEFVAPAVTGGLNVIALHAVRMNGTASQENVTGNTSLLTVNPPSLGIVTNTLAGSRDLSMHSTTAWPGLGAASAGPSAPQRFMNLHVKQDVVSGAAFNDLLAKGSFEYHVQVSATALIFAVNMSSLQGQTDRPCTDLDLGVFLDGKGGTVPNGKAEASELVGISAGPTPQESVKIIKPAPGLYIIKVLGFAVPWAPYGTFNMDLTLVQGAGFAVAGTTSARIPAEQISTVRLSWNLQGSTPDGHLLGALYLGPSVAPLMLLIPIDLTIDRVAPVFTDFKLTSVDPRVVVSDADGRTLNTRRPTIVASFSDPVRGELDPSAVRVLLDGADVTTVALVSVPWSQNASAWGAWLGTVQYTPAQDLPEGVHTVRIDIADVAGNAKSLVRTIIVDTLAPALSVDGPPVRYTRSGNATLEGATEPGTTVAVGGTTVVTAADGRFSFTLPLAAGRNDVTVAAWDWAHVDARGVHPGNRVELGLTIVWDTLAPALSVHAGTVLTSSAVGAVQGQVTELLAPNQPGDPTTVVVTVGGQRVWAAADGTFAETVALAEGPNIVPVTAVDLAGNTASTSVRIDRDSTAPALELGAVPGSTTAGSVNVSGKAEPGAIVFVNGIVQRTGADGTFSRLVTLSGGTNVIVVRAEDAAGNAAERTLVVNYAAPSDQGTTIATWVAVAAIAAVLAGILGAMLASRGGGPGETEEAAPEEAVEVAPREEPGPEEGTAEEEQAPAVEEERPPEEPVLEEAPVEEPAAVPTPPPAPAPAPAPAPSAPADADTKAARLRRAFDEGKITREVYGANLMKAFGIDADARAANLTRGFVEGRIGPDIYEANLRRLAGRRT